MDLRDYLRMVGRGWSTVLLITAISVGLAVAYVALAPKRYETSTVLFVSANEPRTIDDLQQGNQFSTSAVTTYAEIIDSATVLGPVATQLRPQSNADELGVAVWAIVPTETTLINVTASADSPQRAAAIANAVAGTASRVVPALVTDETNRPLVRFQQTRPAVEPTIAISPNVHRTIGLSLIVGLCLGFGATIVAQSLDTRIRQAADVHKLTEVPLLAVLSSFRRGQRGGLVARDDPPMGEAFRTLRTNLRSLDAKERRSLVCAAVADDRDGAQVATNLAWSLAAAGRRVLLVDLDMRQSTVGDLLGMKAGIGLADILMGRVDMAEAIRATRDSHLRVILSGTLQANPSDLLSDAATTRVLRRMEQENDVVILHAPPLLTYTDAAAVSGAAGGALLTVTAGRTKANELSTALTTLTNVWAKPVGVVLTGARRSELGRSAGTGYTRQVPPTGRAPSRPKTPQPVNSSTGNRAERHTPAFAGRHASNRIPQPPPGARPRPPAGRV